MTHTPVSNTSDTQVKMPVAPDKGDFIYVLDAEVLDLIAGGEGPDGGCVDNPGLGIRCV